MQKKLSTYLHSAIGVVVLFLFVLSSSAYCQEPKTGRATIVNYAQPLPTNSPHSLNVWCEYVFSGQPISCTVEIGSFPNWNSGGHLHNTGRLGSTISPAIGPAPGTFTLTTTAVAQEECLLVCPQPTAENTCDGPSFWVGDGWPDVNLLWTGEHTDVMYYNGAPPTPGAPNNNHGTIDHNHYMQSGPALDLLDAVNTYRNTHGYPPPPQPPLVCVNDQSLPWGGLFDVNQNWMGPHDSHRVGTSADVNKASGQCPYDLVLSEMESACEQNNANPLSTGIHNPGPHVHCEW